MAATRDRRVSNNKSAGNVRYAQRHECARACQRNTLPSCGLRTWCSGFVRSRWLAGCKRLFLENYSGGRTRRSGPGAWNSTGVCRPRLTCCRPDGSVEWREEPWRKVRRTLGSQRVSPGDINQWHSARWSDQPGKCLPSDLRRCARARAGAVLPPSALPFQSGRKLCWLAQMGHRAPSSGQLGVPNGKQKSPISSETPAVTHQSRKSIYTTDTGT